MEAIIYLLTGTVFGWRLTGLFIDGKHKSEEKLNLFWVRLVSSFGIGVMLETWMVYVLGYVFSQIVHIGNVLFHAEACAIAIFAAIILVTFIRPIMKKMHGESGKARGRLIRDWSLFVKEVFFYAVLLIFVSFTFRYVLNSDGDWLHMGYTVFSDYAPNLALIRSFSWFENFPTQYPFFAGEDIKYHFMFMFLCGNLERMGLPLEIAYNLPSILGLFGFLVLLTQFTLRVTGRKAAGVLVPFLFFFRSGLALFYYIAEHLRAGDIALAFRENTVFIGYTPNENWGLWNYNVYLNQRHLGFGLLVVMAVIWYYYGYVENASVKNTAEPEAEDRSQADFKAVSDASGEMHVSATNAEGAAAEENTSDEMGVSASSEQVSAEKEMTSGGIISSIKELWFTLDAWALRDPLKVLITATVLGLLSFWNGSCVIGGLLVLAGFAVFSRNKLDFLFLAILTVSLSFMQTNFFISGSAVSPTFYWGFISESKTVAGVLWFLIEISGMTIIGAVFAVFVLDRKYRPLICAFILPVIFSFTMSLTPDVTVNHKYIMMAMAFLSVIWAEVLVELWTEKRRVITKIFAVALAVFLTATGIYDFVIIMRNNGTDHEYVVNTESGLGHYLRDNLTWNDMVLSGPDSVSEFTVSGCRMYSGWPYYAWSAGYNTDYRYDMAKYMYSIGDGQELAETLREENITYVLFQNGLVYEDVVAREDIIAEIGDLVYESEDGYYRLYHVG